MFKIEDTILEEKKMDYCAILYATNENKKDVPLPNEENIKFISFDDDDKENDLKIVNPQKYFLPTITFNTQKNIQRDSFVVFGASGSGKSVFINFMAMLHNILQPEQKIYFFTNNNYKIDNSLTHSLYNFMDLKETLLELDIDEFQTSNEYDNTLLIFDDVDLKHNKELNKKYFDFLNILLIFKRKNKINLIISTHAESGGHIGKLLYTEMTNYVFFNNNLKNRSNIILTDYLKLTSSEIKEILKKNKHWICINTKKKIVMSPKKIFPLE